MKNIFYAAALALLIFLPAAARAGETELRVGNMGSSIKPAMVVLAHEMGYYKDEGLDVKLMQISNLNEGVTALQLGKLDILPLGVIPIADLRREGRGARRLRRDDSRGLPGGHSAGEQGQVPRHKKFQGQEGRRPPSRDGADDNAREDARGRPRP